MSQNAFPVLTCDKNRSLWTIISTCLSTIFACTYVCIHPNVPAYSDSTMRITITRIALMLSIIWFPELVVVWALRQQEVARRLQIELRITRTHAFFLGMGGFAAQIQGKVYPLYKQDIIELGLIEQIRKIDEKDISDKSKGDPLSKGFALLQVCWFLVQCIARGIQHLPLTHLEIVTISFAALNFFVYAAWWNKPLGVVRPIILTRNLKSPLFLSYAPYRTMWSGGSWLSDDSYRVPVLWPGEDLPFEKYTPKNVGKLLKSQIFMFLCILTCFGVINTIAWNFDYPSVYEQMLWRIASLCVFVGPLVTLLGMTAPMVLPTARREGVYYFFRGKVDRYVRMMEQIQKQGLRGLLFLAGGIVLSGMFFLFLVTPFLVGRVVILVLPFVLLRDLPPEAYCDVSWTRFIPHLSG